jgi:hypothetical protein
MQRSPPASHTENRSGQAIKVWMRIARSVSLVLFLMLPQAGLSSPYLTRWLKKTNPTNATYPLTLVPSATAAYGVRLLNSNYAGPLINIRRSSDNSTEDVYPSGNQFPVSAVSTWAGGSTIYVTKWYDQTGNGNHISQSTTTTQPTLTLNAYNGFPGVTFSSANSTDLNASFTFVSGNSPWTGHAVLLNDSSTSDWQIIWKYGTDATGESCFMSSQDGGAYNWASGFYNVNTESSFATSVPAVFTTYYDGSSITSYVQGNTWTSSFSAGNITGTTLHIGSDAGGSQFSNAALAELILYPRNLSASLVSTLQNNSLYYYSILRILPATASAEEGSTVTFSATYGTPPYTFSVASGGGSINSSTGVFTVPSPGTSVIKVTDYNSYIAYGSITSTVTAVQISPATITIGEDLNTTFTGSGTAPYAYSVTSGNGTINSLSGVFTAPSTAETDTVTITDANGYTAQATVTILPLAINPSTNVVALNGTTTFTAAYGSTPYTYSVVSGTGTINSSTGVFTAPTGAETDTVQVVDANSHTAQATVTVKVLSSQTFSYTGSSQSFTVPSGITSIIVKSWAGGGGGGAGCSAGAGAAGAGGGFAQATLSVTPGQILTVLAGGGGTGGNFIGRSGADGGGGGGASGIQQSGSYVIIAGGGGGGAGCLTTATGGVGGGASGGNGSGPSGNGGSGGTSSAVGSAGTATTAGTNGSGNTGGNGGSSTGTVSGTGGYNGGGLAGRKITSSGGGGGGGGGYFGGGGGSGGNIGGGGGGSSNSSGTNVTTTSGSGTSAGNTSDSAYISGVGTGGPAGAASASTTASGGNGYLVIYY